MEPSMSWAMLCASAQSYAVTSASGRSPEIAEMIHTETAAFCAQPPPLTRVELDVRYMQSRALTSIKIGNLTYADTISRSHPVVARSIIDAAKDLCTGPLPTNREELAAQYIQSGALTSVRIANLTYADTTAGSHPAVAEWIMSAATELCMRPLPGSHEEMEVLHIQSRAVTGIKISSYCYADRMAGSHPAVASLILDATKPVRNLPLPITRDELRDQHRVTNVLTSIISQIIYAHSLR
jgi:hypothetical protein